MALLVHLFLNFTSVKVLVLSHYVLPSISNRFIASICSSSPHGQMELCKIGTDWQGNVQAAKSDVSEVSVSYLKGSCRGLHTNQ